jgi:Family of unknown function (DUF5825)
VTVFPADVAMTLWKDRDPAARRLAGMYAGSVDRLDDPLTAVASLAASGVRFARLRDPVDLADVNGVAAAAALVAVRELTSHGIAVDWTIRMPAGAAGWQRLSHLYPPAVVRCGSESENVTTWWRDSFHAAKCGYRRGPGFLEIRDRRTGSFRRTVIRSARSDQAIAPLLRGMPAAALDETVTRRYLDADLVHQAGQYLWWTPYLIRRWPLSTTIP